MEWCVCEARQNKIERADYPAATTKCDGLLKMQATMCHIPIKETMTIEEE